MTTIELYTKGARVWVPNPERVWEGAEVLEDYKDGAGKLKLRLDASGNTLEVALGPDKQLPPLRNPDILVGENDLTSLSYLHEPAVLHNLQVRFCRHNAIYTYCGIVLVAINPYSELPIYGSDTVWTYRGQSMGDLDPHIFAVAEEAYTKLEREQRDQSIIVSGESGAGKTVSAKYAMRYFAIVGGSSTETQVEKKVLASSPIMEAIGNAKTTRNDNSSRFGKYIEIHFDRAYHIVGASMRTYLLEKSRVVFQAPEERNYHVFYQLCASRDQHPDLKLAHPDEFVYLNQGGAATIDGVDDAKSFVDMVGALTLLGFGPKEQNDMWRVLAAVLHLGNVQLTPQAEGTTISSKDRHLAIFCELLEIDINEMRTWLCQRRIVSVREVLNTPMNVKEATAAKGALAKHVYAELFNWIVGIVNKALESGTNSTQKFIGVLDIYGFETFEINSFEQFCINYANEKLQQQFNQHVFKLEQEEYLKEEIEWKFIDFYDNQPCIDLIETRLGILDLLDEECRMPKGKDSSWAEKLYSQCTKWKHFSKPRFGTTAFLIKHFADNVQYEVAGFLEKNRDTVMEEQITVLRGSQNKLVQKLFADEARRLVVPAARVKVTPSQPQAQSKQNKKTVGSQFRDSLNMLMSTLNATTPHYIRCIKPNDVKKPFEYNAVRAVQQLRACGVLETIRISAAGFPSRWTYGDFFQRYRVLCVYKDIDYDNLRATCGRILNKLIKDEDKYKFGRTKLFFRAGQVAYMEKLRAERLRLCCIKMQAQVRGFIARKRYLRKRNAASTIQRWVRGFIARRRVYHMRRERAATIIQRRVRGWVKLQQYQRLRRTILSIQTHARGLLARRRYLAMRYNHAAIVIQTSVRRWLCRNRYLKNRKKIIVAQSAIRRFLAKRRFRKMKKEARSVEHVKKLNKGLENKIISLQQKIGELTKENTSLKSVQNDVNEMRQRLDILKGVEAELKRTTNTLREKDGEIEKLQKDLQKERDEKMDLINEEERWKKEKGDTEKKLADDNEHLKALLDAANEQIKLNQLNAEEILKARLEQEKQLLIREQDQDRSAYQKLLRDFHALEQRSDQMERELARIHREGGNIPNTLRKNKHQRTPSSASTMSMQDDALSMNSEIPDDGSTDHGYGSVRSNTSPSASHLTVENTDWQTQQSKGDSPEAARSTSSNASPDVDVGLVLKLQTKLQQVTKERTRLSKRLDALDQDLNNLSETTARTQEAFRVQELEMENQKLKSNLDNLRLAATKGNTGAQQLLSQFNALELELERRREECIQLHTILSDKTSGMKNIAQSSYGKDVDIMNEDGELVLAFEAQKKINRQLENELQEEKQQSLKEHDDLRGEIERLLIDNEKLQSLFSESIAEGASNPAQAYLQFEVSRLTQENLDWQEKYELLAEENNKLRAQLKILDVKIKGLTGGDPPLTGGVISSRDINQSVSKFRTTQPPQPAPRSTVESQNKRAADQSGLPVVRKKDREYLGMFEYAKEDEHTLVQRLINDLKPKTAVNLLPGLPSYILMMCIRHTDYINDDEKVRSLLTAIINTVKKLIKKKHEDLDTIVLWLSNVLRLLHNMKQYSGDKTFQEENTPKQNEQCLRNFDLAEYRQVLSDVAVWIYQALISILEEKIQPYVVPAILENEAITGLSSRGGGGGGRRGRTMSDADVKPGMQQALDAMIGELSSFHRTLGFHGVDPEVITQVFRQLFYFICASALNNLLLRKDLCHWSKGMQIRYNLSHLEQWTRDHKLLDPCIVETLAPIIQAAQLLQARKTDEDVQSVCDMCDRLTVHQIIKLLNLYTPADDYEERVPLTFIKKIQARLQERAELQANQFAGEPQVTLLMDSKQSFPVRFPFNPSNIRLEDIEVPAVLNVPMLKKI